MSAEGTYLNMIKKPTANIVLSGEKLKVFLPRLGIRQERPLSPLLFKIVSEVLAMAIREKNIKNPDWKRNKTLTL